MEWFEKLGYDKDPFELNPLKTGFSLIGRDKQAKEILYRIMSGSMLLVEGGEGTGKTALLKHAIDNFKGKGKVIYADAGKLNKKLDINDLLKKKPKGMILLMDNVQFLSKKNNQRIKYHYDQDQIRSVVFTTPDCGSASFTDAIKDRIGKNIIKLKKLSQSSASEAARERLSRGEMLPDDVLKQLYSSSDNLKDFLRQCGLLCGHIVKKGEKEAKKEDIADIPKPKTEEKEGDERDNCPECGNGLAKIGEYWRCMNCDQYCTSCGALADDEDDQCPGCGAKFKTGDE